MGDNAEFEKLTTLEARLAAALDRIAVGLGEATQEPPLEDPAMTSGAFEDAVVRAESAEARVGELEALVVALQNDLAAAQLAQEATPAQQPTNNEADFAALHADRDTLAQRAQALEAAREADRDEMNRAIAARDAEVERLVAELEAAQAAMEAAPATETAGEGTELDELRETVEELQMRVHRLRAERAEAIAERDDARDVIEELRTAGSDGPDIRTLALRAEASELRMTNDRLARIVSRMREQAVADPETLNKSLSVELSAMKAARASEAAELDRIVNDIETGLDEAPTPENGHA